MSQMIKVNDKLMINADHVTKVEKDRYSYGDMNDPTYKTIFRLYWVGGGVTEISLEEVSQEFKYWLSPVWVRD